MSCVSFTQPFSYFGKKNYIEFGARGNYPGLYNYYNSIEDFIDYNFNLSYFRIKNNSFAFGLEFNQDYITINPGYKDFTIIVGKTVDDPINSTSYYELDYRKIFVSFNKISFIGRTLMPKIQYTVKDNFLPIGTVHEFGIGIGRYKLTDVDYIIEEGDNYPEVNNQEFTEFLGQRLYDKSKSKFKSFNISYTFTVRKPITKNLLLFAGFNYSLNFIRAYLFQNQINNNWDYNYFNEDVSYDEDTGQFLNDKYFLENHDIAKDLLHKKFLNLFSLKIGMTFCF